MRLSWCSVLLGLALLASGCGGSKSASARQQAHRPPARVTRPASWVGPSDPGPRGAIAEGETAERTRKEVVVAVQKIEILPLVATSAGATIAPERRLLLLRIQVTSNKPRSTVVSPERFALEDEEGNTMPSRPSGPNSPNLSRTYLDEGESVEGWLTYEIPADHGRFRLTSSLRDLPLVIPLSASEDPSVLQAGVVDGASGTQLAEVLLAQAKVDILGVERVPLGTLGPRDTVRQGDRDLLALEIAVKSGQRARLLVAPERFSLESEEGEAMPRRKETPKGRTLQSSSLAPGESSTGWLVYEIPAELERFQLTSDLRSPPLRLPVRSPTR